MMTSVKSTSSDCNALTVSSSNGDASNERQTQVKYFPTQPPSFTSKVTSALMSQGALLLLVFLGALCALMKLTFNTSNHILLSLANLALLLDEIVVLWMTEVSSPDPQHKPFACGKLGRWSQPMLVCEKTKEKSKLSLVRERGSSNSWMQGFQLTMLLPPLEF